MGVSNMHWLSAPAMLGTIGTVLAAQQADKKDKGAWMFRHKSLGLLTGLLVCPRLVTKLMSVAPKPVPGNVFEMFAAKASHVAMYGFMVIMPVSGVAMGYFGGKGLPFFWTTLPGATEKNGKIAGQSFKIHKFVGEWGKYIFPIHVGGAAMHVMKGQSVFYRINPFGR